MKTVGGTRGNPLPTMATKAAVLAFLAAHPGSTAHDVAAGLDIWYVPAAMQLLRLSRRGLVVREGRGPHRYRLP